MCHQAIRPTLPDQGQASGGAPSADSDLPVQDEHQNQDNEVSQATDNTPVMHHPTDLQEEIDICCGTNHQPVEPQGDDHNHFSCTSGGTLSSRVHKKDEEVGGNLPLPSSHNAAHQNSPPENIERDLKLNFVPQSAIGENESCVEAQSDSKSHDSGKTSLLDSQTDDKSWKENLEYNDATQSSSDCASDWDLKGPRD